MIQPLMNMKQPIYSIGQPSPAVNAGQSFGGGWDAFLGGVGDTFDTLLGGALMVEQYRNMKDAKGEGQSDVINAVEKPYQTNAKPLNEQEYRTMASGGQSPQLPQGGNNTVLVSAVALGVLFFLFK